MSAGFIITKPGFSADRAKIQDTYVNTKAPILKVAFKGQGTMGYSNAENSVTKDVIIDHDLGYKPLIQAFSERLPGSNMRAVLSTNQAISSDTIVVISSVNEKRMLIRFISRSTGNPLGSYRYYYYIFSDEGQE